LHSIIAAITALATLVPHDAPAAEERSKLIDSYLGLPPGGDLKNVHGIFGLLEYVQQLCDQSHFEHSFPKPLPGPQYLATKPTPHAVIHIMEVSTGEASVEVCPQLPQLMAAVRSTLMGDAWQGTPAELCPPQTLS
jgi:hypothetical protein